MKEHFLGIVPKVPHAFKITLMDKNANISEYFWFNTEEEVAAFLKGFELGLVGSYDIQETPPEARAYWSDTT